MAAIGVGGVGAKGRDFHMASPSWPDDRHHPKRSADGERAAAAKEFTDHLWSGGGRHVVIRGCPAEELIADAAAGPERLVPSLT